MADQIYTPDQLAKDVRVGGDAERLVGADAPVLDEQATQQVIADRLRGLGGIDFEAAARGQGDLARGGDVALMIARAIPKGLRSPALLASIDLRPYLKALDGKVIEDQRWSDRPTGKAVTYQAHTTAYLDAETKRIADSYGDPEDPAQPNAAPEYNPRQAGVTPMAAVAATQSGQVPAGTPDPVTGEFNSLGTSAHDRFPVEELRLAVQGGMSIDELPGQEGAAAKALGAAPDDPSAQFPVAVRGRTTRTVNTVSAAEALGYLSQLKPSEVAKLQVKMANAGYFDQIGNAAYLEGDAHDDATFAAWKALLTDSVSQNLSVPEVLGQRMRTYRDQVRKSRLGQISAYDPSYSRAVADDLGQSMFGRNLTDQEAQGLDSYLRTIVHQRAGFVAGAENNPVAGRLQSDRQGNVDGTGYTSGDVEHYVQDHTVNEQRAFANRRRAYRLAQELN